MKVLKKKPASKSKTRLANSDLVKIKSSPKIVTHAGLSLNLSQVKCFKLNIFNGIGKKNTMIVEFKTRYDFIQSPETGKWEKQEYNEITELTFPTYEIAQAYVSEF